MGIYDNFSDRPNRLKTEAQEITIKFERLGDGRAKISWNIPPSSDGCGTDGVYDGILITISNKPADYIKTSPKDGTYYSADPTADFDIHSGDKLDTAYVIGAFYNDRVTTSIEIDGIKDKTPYYVSGYAVDSVCRYHREGVHAYSIPTGIHSYVTEDYPAKHEISIYSQTPLLDVSPTGLEMGKQYNFTVKIGNCTEKTYTIRGSYAQNYKMLEEEINYNFILSDGAFISPDPPNKNTYLYKDNNLYFWNGYTATIINEDNILVSKYDPETPVNGVYWLDKNTNILKIYDSSISDWVNITNIINSSLKPDTLINYEVWYNGTVTRVWENNHWCDYNTIVSPTDPRLPLDMGVGYYWYDSKNKEFFGWNEINNKWDDKLVIYYDIDPNSLPVGTFWYDETAEKIFELNSSGSWDILSNVLYEGSLKSGKLSQSSLQNISALDYWFDIRLNKFYQRNITNTDWVQLQFVSYPLDPKIRKSCDLWWNSNTDELFSWETVTNSWVKMDNFFIAPNDPREPALLPDKTAWLNPNTNTVVLIDGTSGGCNVVKNILVSDVDPRNITTGRIWFDGNDYYILNSSGEWEKLEVLKTKNNPFLPKIGLFWIDISNLNNIKLYNYISVTSRTLETLFTTDEIFPDLNELWLDTQNDILFTWNGSNWLPTIPSIVVQFEKRKCKNDYDKLVFRSKKVGSNEYFEILQENNTLFESLGNTIIYNDPVGGWDGLDAGPMYQQLGVGDDGSPDERRSLHEEIRFTFGHPSVKVELTKQQIDRCIDNALLVLRKYSTYAYKKGMFFLDLIPNQQIYLMTNRKVGFNKIVKILSIHRLRAGAFLSPFSAANDLYVYAAVQQLYNIRGFDILTYHLSTSYMKELEQFFASRIVYDWNETNRQLKIFQVPRKKERVLIESVIERTEQELLTDRETVYWVKRWAIVEAKAMLAQVRGKYATLPGPNGSITLNASDLSSQITDEKAKLMEEITSLSMQDMENMGAGMHVVVG